MTGSLLNSALPVLRCPLCKSALSSTRNAVRCTGRKPHRFEWRSGVLIIESPADVPPKYTKVPGVRRRPYDELLIWERYAGLIAYAYETLHNGLSEPLYRTVSSLVAQCLPNRQPGAPPHVIVSAGCGVGRETADAAELAPDALVLALDGARPMLDMARRIVLGKKPVELNHLGDGTGLELEAIRGRGCTNVLLMQADAQRLPIRTASADLVLSTYMIDRLTTPEDHLRECWRVLRGGGHLILTDPLNWKQPANWQKYGRPASVLKLVRRAGFAVDQWFDELPFLEIKDARGSFDYFQTLVIVGRKRG